jgi:hypothetical protein
VLGQLKDRLTGDAKNSVERAIEEERKDTPNTKDKNDKDKDNKDKGKKGSEDKGNKDENQGVSPAKNAATPRPNERAGSPRAAPTPKPTERED